LDIYGNTRIGETIYPQPIYYIIKFGDNKVFVTGCNNLNAYLFLLFFLHAFTEY